MASSTATEPGGRARTRAALIAILLLAAAARFADLDWDDGHAFHPDERAIVFAVQRMSFAPLQLDPGFFAYGSFPLYMIRGVTSVLGWFQPAWRDDFGAIVSTGRALSALAGVLTVWALYRLGRRLFGRGPGLLAAVLLAACALHIQCSHFLATDVTLTLLALLALDACVALAEGARPRDAVRAGLWVGLALATKMSGAPLLAPLAVALALAWRRQATLRPAVLALGALVVAALAGQPYAVLSFAEFWRQVSEQGAMVRQAGSLPYTIQYVGVPKYAYDLWQMAVWAMGPALGAAVLWATGRALWGLRASRTPSALVLASWVVPFVLLTGAFDVKYPRYLLPVYPILILWAAAWLWDARATRHGRVLLLAVPGATVLTALAFLSVYRGPHTSAAASAWVYQNVPEGATLLTQHWDEGFPMPLAGQDPRRYRVVEFGFYEPDTDGKRDDLARELSGADCVVLPTKRILGAVTRAPDRFPMTNNFYRLLFAGRLGFTLAHEQSARPRLGPIELPDELADESLSVYDHPKVLVFRNVERLGRDEIARRLSEGGAATGLSRSDLLRAGRATRAPLGLVWGRDPVRQGALALVWWALLVEALALAAYALLARWLPELGGFALARVLGLLLLAWPAWWLGYTFERSFGPALLVVLSAVAIAAGALAWRARRWRWPAEAPLVEALFWGAFAVFVLVRAGNPAVFWGEKPMDFAFLNTLTRATSLPPPEPWFAGSILHYTWFGHFVAAALGKACGLHPGVTFNLAVALTGALVVVGAFALGAIAGRSRRVGLLSALLVGLVGNLAGPLELWWRRRAPFDAFWAGSRVVPNTINEYPLWSVLFADLHAHLLVLPFTLAFLALLVEQARAPVGARTRPRLALLALLLGAILATNGWSGVTQPLLLPLVLLVLWPAGRPRDVRTLVSRVALPCAAVGLGALALFAPFWRGYQPPARNVGWERAAFAAFPEYAIVFGLFLFITLPLVLRPLARGTRLAVSALLAVCAALSILRPEWGAWRAGMLALAGAALWLACRRSEPMRVRTAAGLLAAGFLLTLAADLVFLWDRMNTVFKLYLDAWLLLGSGSAVALVLLWRTLPGRGGQAWRLGVALLTLAAAITGWQGAYAALVEPRIESPRPTLDGVLYLAARNPWEAAALEWLNAEVRGTPVVAEAWGESYGGFARVSMNTGLPTILGWDYHVHQRAHAWPSIDARKADVARLYESKDPQEVHHILARYAVRYVYVGEVEQRTYGAAVGPRLAGFTDLLRPVYRNREVLILAVEGGGGAADEGVVAPLAAADTAPVATPTPLPGLMREPRSVAVDEDGHVWVADFGNHRVQALTPDLEPLLAFGTQGKGPAQFEQPCALALAAGRVYVADTWNGRVQVLDREGRMTSEWRGSFFGPRGIAVGPDGRVFLADTGNHRIRVFDPEGAEVAAWGQRGSGPADLDEPMCVGVDAKGRVYVCDNGNARVSVFDSAGTPIRSFAVAGWRAGVYSEPKLALAPSGTIWVTVPLAGVVRAYGPDGQLQRELAGPPDDTPFRTPLGVAYDSRGPSLLVTDLENRVVRVPLAEPGR